MKTISQVAQLTGVSVRTLQYYDEIDLLKPAAVTDAGYRMYDEAALERLQQILFFRELDFRLKEIKEIMENPEYDKQEVFRKQKKMIRAKRDRLTRLLKLLDKLEKGEDCMSFDAFDLTEYFELMENFKQQNEEEVIRVWGSVENYERLINKVKADEQRVGELAVKYYGSTENYTRVIEEGLNKIPDIINDAWTQKTNALYRKLTGDLTRDARSEEVQAIVRELTRGGQVYYVYNRVNNIADVAAALQQLVPEAVVAFAHGQMKEHELERIMYDFINGEIDVLVATTIIETGLDISNVNTMIIHDSDQLGLSQLYQLRGRVGRSNRTAYAFLMYKRDKMLKEIAEKRLSAIREFTDLGSGFKIAMRDLEIRGAGNLLGRKQHGHMEAVGYDLYCKMLNEAVKNLKGELTIVDFTTTVELEADAFIPPSYIVNEQQKLDIYKRIAGVETHAESEDMKEELLDRFGEVPKSVDNLLRIALIRVLAHELYITEVKGRNGELKITMRPDANLKGENLPVILGKHKNKLTFSARGTPVFFYRYKKCGVVEKDAENLIRLTEGLLADMKEILAGN